MGPSRHVRNGPASRVAGLCCWLIALFGVVRAARAQVGVTVAYDPGYTRIPYPGGDVPRERGVCTDVVVRAFRAVGIDLQRQVHEDMRAHFSASMGMTLCKTFCQRVS